MRKAKNKEKIMEVVNSTILQHNGIPRGKRLITEAEIRAMGRQDLIDLEAVTPVLQDHTGNTGSREWWLFERSPGNYGKVDINEFNTFLRCNGTPKHMMAILKDV